MTNRRSGFWGYVLGFTALLAFLYITNDNIIKSQLRNMRLNPSIVNILTSESVEVVVDARTTEHFKYKAAQRRLMLDKKPSEFHNILAEEILCPNLFRVGRVGDGGKWICGPQFITDWDHKCVLYSFGINRDPSFETEIHNVTEGKCDIVAVDMNKYPYPTEQLASINAQYIETAISSKTTNKSITVTDLMKKMNHDHIDVLKMDIEGYEYDVADEVFGLGICQMMVELHTKGESYKKFVDWLRNASTAGYFLVHHEINIKHMECVEVTLLHQSCFDRFGPLVPLARFLNSD
uniref:Methyltranfer_dom domain-containing protein n=1 Tax=Panagrellus redivivus TaxID=6233 RepID=A0A7E4USE7_PANRE